MAYERTDKKAQQRARWVRWTILGVVLVGMTAIATAHQFVTSGARPVPIDALCPFGGLETMFSLVAGTGFLEKTAASAVVLLVGMLGMAIVYRRSFCGQLCPLGALQGIFGSLRHKLLKRRFTLPSWLDRPARFLKYAVLAFFLLWTWQAATLVMRPYDPWVAWAHLTSSELLAELGIGLAVLAVSLVGSFVYDRFFCKYLCPTGAVLGLISRISVFKIARDADACTNCKACDKACPMNVEVSTIDVVKSSECISCNECVNACPAQGALEVKAPRGSVTSPVLVTSLVAVLMLGLIGVTTATGTFTWRMPTLAEALKQGIKPTGEGEGQGHESETRQTAPSGEGSAAETPSGSGSEPAAQGTAPNGSAFDTSLIKGYMSMKEISDATGITAEQFTQKWGVPAADQGKPMKEIKDQYGFTPDDVRTWVGEQLGR